MFTIKMQINAERRPMKMEKWKVNTLEHTDTHVYMYFPLLSVRDYIS